MQKNILLTTSKDGITSISINRPDVYNSLDEETCIELLSAFKVCEQSDTRVVILTGIGKGFSSGQDLRAILEKPDLKPSELVKKTYNPLIQAMRDLPKPIICKLNGVAAGAGCSLALACDIIIASEDASMTEAFVNIGLVPDSGSSYFLPRILGRLKAFELLSLGTKLSAIEAEKIGLINKVVPAQLLTEAVETLAIQYLNSPLKAVGMIKKMLNKSYQITLAEALEMEAEFQDTAAATEDFKEGVLSFKEKRKPKFKGK